MDFFVWYSQGVEGMKLLDRRLYNGGNDHWSMPLTLLFNLKKCLFHLTNGLETN
mgnify:CR=1 FL=1